MSRLRASASVVIGLTAVVVALVLTGSLGDDGWPDSTHPRGVAVTDGTLREIRVGTGPELPTLGRPDGRGRSSSKSWNRARRGAAPKYVQGRLLVAFRPRTSESIRKAVIRRLGGKVVQRWALVPNLELATIRNDLSVGAAVGQLRRESAVSYSAPDFNMELQAMPNDPSISESFGGESSIGEAAAWGRSTGTNGSPVAILDTGIDLGHPDLAANIWTNRGEIADNGIDDDGNGYVDDVHGWDFISNDNNPSDNDSGGFSGHGTHVAGIVGAVGNNSLGTAGVAWKTSLMALKICSGDGACPTSAAISALQYAIANGAQISNNSYGGASACSSQAFESAVSAAASAGHLLVAAAGNSSGFQATAGLNNDVTPFCPASFPQQNVLSVAASTTNGYEGRGLASFSHYGMSSVDIAAPGQGIYSTLPPSVDPSGYGRRDGTSMAAPKVTGGALLLKDLHPDWTPSEIKQALVETADTSMAWTRRISNDFWGTGYADRVVAGGILDLAAATALTTPRSPTIPLFIFFGGPGGGAVTVSGVSENCVGSCTKRLSRDSSLTLSASPDANSEFDRWSGACTGTGACHVTLNQIQRVRANFNRKSVEPGWTTTDLLPPSGSPPNEDRIGYEGAAISGDGSRRAITTIAMRLDASAPGLIAGTDGKHMCEPQTYDKSGVEVQSRVGATYVGEAFIRPPLIGTENPVRAGACSKFGALVRMASDGKSLLVGSEPSDGDFGGTVPRRIRCAAYVYRRDVSDWELTKVLVPQGETEDGTSDREIGESACGGDFGMVGDLSADGNHVAILSTRDSDRSNRVDLFDRSADGAWSFTRRIEGPVCSFGRQNWARRLVALSADGSTLVLGAPGCDQALVYSRSGTEWTLIQTITPSDGSHWFGAAVALSADGKTAVISAGLSPNANTDRGQGFAFVYDRGDASAQFGYRGRLPGPPIVVNDNWMGGRAFDCSSVTADGGRILCSSLYSERVGQNDGQGSLWVFDRARGWATKSVIRTRLIASSGQLGEELGGDSQPTMSGTGSEIVGLISPRQGGSNIDLDPFSSTYGSYVRRPNDRVGYSFTYAPPASPGAIRISAPASDGAIVRGTTLTIGFATDEGASPSTGFECAIDSEDSFKLCESPLKVDSLTLGVHRVYVRGYGANGSLGPVAERSFSVAPSLSPPVLSGAPSSRTNSTSALISFSGEAGASFQCSVDGGDYSSCTSPKTLSGLSDGDHSLSVMQADAAGNESDAVTASWTVDATPPDLAVITSQPSSSRLPLSTSDVAFTAVGAASTVCSIDGSSFSACSSPVHTSSLSVGAHSVAIKTVDELGNQSSAVTASWSVLAPVSPVITSKPGSSSLSQSADVSFTAVGAVSTRCSVDGGAYTACTSPVRLSNLTNGAHSVAIKAFDSAGNQSPAATASWSMDLPVGVSINDAGVYTNNPLVSLSLIWKKGVTWAYVSNDGGFRTARKVNLASFVPWTLVSSGNERLPKTVYIKFGTSSTTYTDDIILDQTAPVVDTALGSTTTVFERRAHGAAAKVSKPAVKITLTAHDTNSGVGKVQITENKAKTGTLASYAKTLIVRRSSSSVKTFYVRVQDRAKNYSAWKTVTVK